MKLLSALLLIASLLTAWPAQAQQRSLKLLQAEAEQGQVVLDRVLTSHGETVEGCRQAAETIGRHRFGPSDMGRLHLIADPAALKSLQLSSGALRVVPFSPRCGWTFIAASLPGGAVQAQEVQISRDELTLKNRLSPVGLWAAAGLLMLAMTTALLLIWRKRWLQQEPTIVGRIDLPAGPACPVELERLQRERDALREQMRAAGIELDSAEGDSQRAVSAA